ncbi:uncharacterized protein LOC106645400 [Copidosoma floridanum]|uniref:uncharacterized protein LOC106645400 n=1 Tax=Copidosoma floridanum TaxID=29053 RepID=UPI0006C9806A|nr:uncharacterized protein LOC106645400 [Copidosoma floridanum]
MVMARYVHQDKGYSIKLIDTIYSHIPAFTDLFDEESWYIFVTFFVIVTIFVVSILSRFITLKPVD